MDGAEERYLDGYEIEDSIVVYQVRVAPGSDEELRPWDGGSHPGWWQGIAFSSATGSWWQDEAMLTETLSVVRKRRLDEGAAEGAEGDEEAGERDLSRFLIQRTGDELVR